MTRKTRAILLNALLMPGMGQLYMGRKVQGIVLILLVNLLMLAALFVLLKAAMPFIVAKMVSGSAKPEEIHNAIMGVAGLAKGVIGAFVVVWGFALFDVARHGKDS